MTEFPKKMAASFIDKLINYYELGAKVPVLELVKNPDKDLRFLDPLSYISKVVRLLEVLF